MNKEYLEAGKIVALHGVRGEMRLKPWSDDSSFLKGFKVVYLSADGKQEVKLISARAHGNVSLIKLEGIDSVEKAQALRGKIVYIKKSDASLPEGRFFISDIIGCDAFEIESGEKLGVVSDIESYPANDVWHIKTQKGEVLIPNIPDVVKKIMPEEGKVLIRKMKGLFDDED